MSATVLPFQRRVICEICARVFVTPDVSAPYLCDPCTDQADAGMWQEWDAEASALGFASTEDRFEFESREQGMTP